MELGTCKMQSNCQMCSFSRLPGSWHTGYFIFSESKTNICILSSKVTVITIDSLVRHSSIFNSLRCRRWHSLLVEI